MAVPSPHPDTELIQLFKAGDKSAANELINRYFDRVYSAANRRLKSRKLRIADADDIAASVFEDLWQRSDENGFDDRDLQDSKELWRLLSAMIENKIRAHFRSQNALKRGGGKLQGESAIRYKENWGNHLISDDSTTGAKLAVARSEHERLLDMLGDDVLIQVATLRLEGYKVVEIATLMEKSTRWVQRKTHLIREIWKQEYDSGSPDESS